MSIQAPIFQQWDILNGDFAERNHEAPGINEHGKNNWETRKVRIAKCLEQSPAHVISLQEVGRSALYDLQPICSKAGYEFLYMPHDPKRGDGVAILYKKNRFSELGCPRSPGSYVSIHDTVAPTVDLIDNLTKKTYRIGTCHLLGGRREKEGLEQLDALQKAMDSDNPDNQFNFYVITGSFHNKTHTRGEQGLFADPKLCSLEQAGYTCDNDPKTTEVNKDVRSSWIWIKSPNTKVRLFPFFVEVDPEASNHFPVTNQIQIKGALVHNQVPGSLGAKILPHFHVTVQCSEAIRENVWLKLDQILRIHAHSSPSVSAIKQLFSEYLDQLSLLPEINDGLLGDLNRAIEAAAAINIAKKITFSSKLCSRIKIILDSIKQIFMRVVSFMTNLFRRFFNALVPSSTASKA